MAGMEVCVEVPEDFNQADPVIIGDLYDVWRYLLYLCSTHILSSGSIHTHTHTHTTFLLLFVLRTSKLLQWTASP